MQFFVLIRYCFRQFNKELIGFEGKVENAKVVISNNGYALA